MIEVKAGRKVKFDVAAHMAQVRHGLPVLLFTRPTESPIDLYAPAHQKLVGYYIEWTVSDYDAAIPGWGQARIITTGTETIFGDDMAIWVNG